MQHFDCDLASLALYLIAVVRVHEYSDLSTSRSSFYVLRFSMLALCVSPEETHSKNDGAIDHEIHGLFVALLHANLLIST